MTDTAEPRRLALRVIAMPRDENVYGTIFGGLILGQMDQAAFVEARRHGAHRWVTAAMDAVEFTAPVHTGDIVTYYTSTIRAGRTSVTVRVEVEAQRHGTEEIVPVTRAQLVMVSVGSDGAPVPFASPATVDETPLGGVGRRP